MLTIWTLTLVLAGLLVLSALASASETALFGLRRAERERIGEQAPGVLHIIERLSAHPRRLLISVLLINIAVNVVYFVSSTVLTRRTPDPGMAAVSAVAAPLAMILFGEVSAKLIASSRRVWFCLAFTRVMALAIALVSPLSRAMDRWLVAPIVRLLAGHAREAEASSVEELLALLSTSAHAGEIESEEQRLLIEIIELGQIAVRDVMTPRVDVRALPEDATRDDVLAFARATRLTEAPIVRGALDDGLVGLLDIKAYLIASERRAGLTLHEFCSRPVYVPDLARLDQLLNVLRTSGAHTAVCVNENGAFVGMVAIEDVVEEMLEATSDAPAPSLLLREVEPGRWIVPGGLPLNDLKACLPGFPVRDLMGDERVSTLAGLVLVRLGRLPEIGDETVASGVRMRVHAMTGRRIDEVEIGFARADGGAS